MDEAVIVAGARTPIGKSYRGAFNNTEAPTLASHAVKAAMEKSSLEPDLIEDCIFGVGLTEGTQGYNVARQIALASGMPMSVAGMTVNRLCSSGVMSIATAAKQIVSDRAPALIAGGCESISLVQNQYLNTFKSHDPSLLQRIPNFYIGMLDTAEVVAKRYDISRDAQDEYALQSQQRTATAQEAGLFDDEIISVSTTKIVKDRETGEESEQSIVLSKDECNRPQTTLESLNALDTVVEGGSVTAGNASQLSDGAAAVIMTSSRLAEQRGLEPLGAYRGMAVAGCDADEMGIGPVFAVPKLLQRFNVSMDDIGLWELNEAFAVQVLYCRDKLGIPNELLNVNGGSISIGHPYGMTGTRAVLHALLEGKRRNVKYVVITMCVGGGMGAAALFEVL